MRHHLLPHHPLCLQVGAGGNAGNQSAIKVIRGLATGAMKPTGAGMGRAMKQQLAVGLMLGTGLAAGGWLRVYITNGDVLNATAISISLFLIVVCSVVAGTGDHSAAQRSVPRLQCCRRRLGSQRLLLCRRCPCAAYHSADALPAAHPTCAACRPALCSGASRY